MRSGSREPWRGERIPRARVKASLKRERFRADTYEEEAPVSVVRPGRPLNISVTDKPDQVIISVGGDDNTPEGIEELKKSFERVLARPSLPEVLLDVTELTYLGSEGVGVIAAAHKSFAERKGRLVIRNPTRQVARVFMVTRLDSFLHIQRDGTGDPAR
jgi:anti-sigma B factor antagonist